jgi:sigma-E factor negative regulatory protein RseC
MEQEAIVTAVDHGLASVEVVGSGSGCGRCHEAGGCQSGMLGRMFRQAPRQFRIANSIAAAPGERVVVRIADAAVLRAALVTYFLPALLIVAGAFAGTAIGDTGNSDSAALTGAFLGLCAALATGYWLRRGLPEEAMRPILVRKSKAICYKESAQ